MNRHSNKPRGLKALFVQLPVPLHIALHKLILKRWEKTGVKPDLRSLLIEAIRKLSESEGIEVSQIETSVSTWNKEGHEEGNISRFPKKRGPRPA
jgi:hypothetical protein